MPSPVSATPAPPAPPRVQPGKTENYFKSLLARLPAHPPAPFGTDAPEKLHLNCNPEIVDSGAAGAGNRTFPAPSESRSADTPTAVDPLALSLACATGVLAVAPEPSSSPPGVASTGGVLDVTLAAEVLQRVAWGGDRRRGVARLELGGDLAGTVVVVRGEGREVTLELTLPAGGSASDLPERLAARLSARGLVVRELVVR
jgi:hypothetical protein